MTSTIILDKDIWLIILSAVVAFVVGFILVIRDHSNLSLVKKILVVVAGTVIATGGAFVVVIVSNKMFLSHRMDSIKITDVEPEYKTSALVPYTLEYNKEYKYYNFVNNNISIIPRKGTSMYKFIPRDDTLIRFNGSLKPELQVTTGVKVYGTIENKRATAHFTEAEYDNLREGSHTIRIDSQSNRALMLNAIVRNNKQQAKLKRILDMPKYTLIVPNEGVKIPYGH